MRCDDCDEFAVVFVGCEHGERVRWCDGDRNAGVGAVIVVIMMSLLLFLLDVNMVREHEGARVTAKLVWETAEVWLR